MESNLSASVVIHNKNNVWISDHMVTHCYQCQIEFGYFTRKHHCRNCGNIFCHNCTKKNIIIPKFITDRPDAADYWNPSYYISSLKGQKEKVCDKCYDEIIDKIKAYEKIVSIFDHPVPIDRIKELSESDQDVKNHYFDHLRNIQYYLPNHTYSNIDIKFLKINAPYLCKHSKYLVHLIKSIDWSGPNSSEDLELVINILGGEKNRTCNELYCTRTCQEHLSFDDCINIMYGSCVVKLPDSLLRYLFDIICKTPEQIILCHLSYFITIIKNNGSNKFLQKLLFDLLGQSEKMIYHMYWFLTNERENSNIIELTNINNFIELFDPKKIKIIYQEYIFFNNLIANLSDPKRYLINVFDRCKPISLPYEPSIKLVGVDLENIVTKSSYTKPVIIPFITTEGVIKLLFKKESVMNDVTVLNLMILSDIILNENLNDNFGVIVYPIMPITLNAGMIEIIDEAETIHTILNRKKTIIQHIVERNENQVISTVLDRYMHSLVCYTLHSYFIGLGDRHLENIMITDDGSIFHIDFGFILGRDAYPLTSTDIKLNSGMIDVIGGAEGIRYKLYLDLCSKGVVLLRKYFNMYFILLANNTKFKSRQIEKFIMNKFQPRQKDSAVITELMAVIKQSNNAYSHYIRDFLHYHNKEKTLQNGVSTAIQFAYGAVKKLSN